MEKVGAPHMPCAHSISHNGPTASSLPNVMHNHNPYCISHNGPTASSSIPMSCITITPTAYPTMAPLHPPASLTAHLMVGPYYPCMMYRYYPLMCSWYRYYPCLMCSLLFVAPPMLRFASPCGAPPAWWFGPMHNHNPYCIHNPCLVVWAGA